MNKLIKEFKEFVMRGNVIDMAVGVIIGGAFNNIVSSLVNDIVMPVITLITGRIDFSNLMIALDGTHYSSLEEAQNATSVIAYGNFIQIVVQFLLTAFVIFMVIKGLNKLHRPAPQPEPEVTTKICPYCKSEIHKDAIKCPHCASDLEA